MPCPLCDTLSQIRAGTHPAHIADLSESSLILSENQGCPGWCILILRDHHEHLELLDPARRARFMDDAARVGAALRTAFTPLRLNYATFCNQVPHLHWHIMPRRPTDPHPMDPVWAWPPPAQRGDSNADARHSLVAQIRAALR